MGLESKQPCNSDRVVQSLELFLKVRMGAIQRPYQKGLLA